MVSLLLSKMSVSELSYVPNRTVACFSALNKIWSIVGLPNLWLVDGNNNKILKYFHRIVTTFLYILVCLQFGSFFTQHHLTEKQKSNRIIFNLAHPLFLIDDISLKRHKTRIKNLLMTLCITLKNVHNDPDVESQMIRKGAFYSIFFLLCISGTASLYGFEGLMLVIDSGYYDDQK